MKKIYQLMVTAILVFILFACTPVTPSEKTFTVTFDTQGGTLVSSQEVIEGNKVTKPNDPAKIDYEFVYWYFNNEAAEFDFNTIISSDITLYALWYNQSEDLANVNPRNDVYYQIFVRSFADSDGDGVGDFNGVTQNLDYLEDLGITAIWMLPVNTTDLDWGSYHGYRIKDYYDVNPEYGTMADYENLISEANSRGIEVVMDLVINHTSDTHPWYIDASSNLESEYRDYYIWTTPSSAFRTFPGGMVDLNLANPEVVDEIKDIMEFWLNKGIHGFRFDAAKHFFEKPGETAPEVKNIVFLAGINAFVKEIDPDAYLIAEIFDYSYQAVDNYYQPLDSLFNFYVAGEILGKVGEQSDRHLLSSNLERAYNTFRGFNLNFVDAPFISNHDIDRYASNGIFQGINGLEKLKQSASVYLTLPGSPHIYYGEELGMTGTKYEGINPHGQGTVYDQYRRAPFIWGDSSKQTTWLTAYDGSDAADSVASQLANPNSLLNHYKDIIEVRRNNPALMYGNYFEKWKDSTTFTQGYVRYYQYEDVEQAVLVIHNLSDDARVVDISFLEYLYGNSLTIPAFGTLIVTIDPSLISSYI